MNVKLQNSPAPWVDPDDAPELSDEFFDNGTWRVGEQVVSPHEAYALVGQQVAQPSAMSATVSTMLRLDVDVLQAFKATGEGWQLLMNTALKEWLSQRKQ